MSRPSASPAKSDSGTETDSRTVRRPRLWRWLAALSVLVVVILIGSAVWRFLPQRRAHYTDADSIDVPVDRATLREILWQPPVRLSAPLNSAGDDYEPRLSADGMTLYLVRGKAGRNADLFFAMRGSGGWTEPQPLTVLNSEHDDLGPVPSPDGQCLYFYSNRPGGSGGYDLWVAHRRRDGDAWGEPVNLGSAVNSPFNDYGPALTPDAQTLYFASNRPRPERDDTPGPDAWPATVREDLYRSDYDLYTCTVSDGGAGHAEPLASLNTLFNEGTPALSPVGDFVYFSSDRPGGAGGFDLYRSRRLAGEHRPVEHLGFAVNTPANELDPALGLGGYRLYFSSDRDAIDEVPAYDLYCTTSREVFTRVEVSQARFDWAAFWDLIGPPLLWLLLALLLLWLLRKLANEALRRKLSLLTRCLLASVLLHVLLMLLFSVWEVTTSLAGMRRQRGGTKVSLASPAMGQGIAAQIRGGFAQVDLPAPEPAELARATELPFSAPADSSPILTVPATSFAGPAPLPIDSRVADVLPAERTPVPSQPDLETVRVSIDRPTELAVAVPAATPGAAISEVEFRLEAPATDPAPRLAIAPPHAAAQVSESSVAIPLPRRSSEHQPPRPVADLAERLQAASSATPRITAASPPSTATTAPSAAVTMNLAMPATEHLSDAQPDTEQPSRRLLRASQSTLPRFDAPPILATAAAVSTATVPLPGQPSSASQGTTATLMSAVTAPDAPSPAPASPTALSNSPSNSVASAPLDLDLPAAVAPQPEEASGTDRRALPAAPATESAPWEGLTLEMAESLPLPMKPSRIGVADPEPAGVDLSSDRVADARPQQPVSAPSPISSPATDLLTLTDLDLPIGDDLAVTGGVFGRVFDAMTNEGLPGATVRLDLEDDATVTALTDGAGAYGMTVPKVPDFFVVSASADGYLPASANVSAEAVNSSTVRVNFYLRPEAPDAIAIETTPDVHHLGDDRFSGSVNSRFQKRAEGRAYRAEFELTAQQVPPYCESAEISMLAKGIELRHRLYINGRRLEARPARSPRDGSFGQWQAPFDPRLLEVGTNVFELRASDRSGDIDDFEFVNVQIHLQR